MRKTWVAGAALALAVEASAGVAMAALPPIGGVPTAAARWETQKTQLVGVEDGQRWRGPVWTVPDGAEAVTVAVTGACTRGGPVQYVVARLEWLVDGRWVNCGQPGGFVYTQVGDGVSDATLPFVAVGRLCGEKVRTVLYVIGCEVGVVQGTVIWRK